MSWISLNVFQRLTRQWDSLHPYNAAQAMKLAGLADRAALASAWEATLGEMGLGAVRAEQGRFRWESLNGQLQEHSDLLGVTAGQSLDQLMAVELNRPFDDAIQLPFRPFVIDDADGYFAGVVYHHWIADSYSVRLLLREWFLRVYDPRQARRAPLRIPAEGYWQLFRPGRANWNLVSGALALTQWGSRFRLARRIEPKRFSDFRVNFSFHHAQPGLIDRLIPAARGLGVTINDMFLAAMAQVCNELVPLQRARRRPDLALGTIVDLRSRSQIPLDDAFGLFLGFTSIFCRPQDLEDPARLLRRVHQQNLRQKSSGAAQASMLRMLAGLWIARMLDREKLLEFYRKRLPLAGGISNINLNREWPAKYHPSPLLDYVRVSPAGPMMPLVFTPTTLGNRLNFGLTCRSSVIDGTLAPQLADRFIANVEKLAQQCNAARPCG